jgi:hypothetical protein
MTKRPQEKLRKGARKYLVKSIPAELGDIDLDVVLQQGLQEAELLLMDALDERAAELGRSDVAHLQFELKPTSSGALLSCWMRGQFNSQLTDVQGSTKCRSLASYLGLLSQVEITWGAG